MFVIANKQSLSIRTFGLNWLIMCIITLLNICADRGVSGRMVSNKSVYVRLVGTFYHLRRNPRRVAVLRAGDCSPPHSPTVDELLTLRLWHVGVAMPNLRFVCLDRSREHPAA